MVVLQDVSAGASIEITAERHEHFHGQPLARWRYRSEIDDLVKRLATGFVGREEELRRLMSFVAEPGGGYFLLEAEGGMGKSSVVVQLLLRHEKGEWTGPRPTLIAFFVRDPGWRKPDEYLASINSQLLEALGRRGGTPGDLLSLRAQFSELWADAVAAASAETPLLLIVDALDEMARGETTIADLLPPVLTEHAHVIVSSRPRPNPRDLVPERHPLRSAPVLRLTSLDQRAVTALLRGMGVPAELAQRLTPRIHSLTRGEPIFARAVAEEVAARGEGTLEALEQEPPAGAREYFLRQLKAIDQAAEDDSTWRICEVLAAAKGALSIDELAGVLALSRRAVRKALTPVERFVIGEDRVQLFHRLLYESLQEEIGDHDLARITARIVAWCSSAQDAGWKDGASHYTLAHYAEHLADAEDHTKLQALIDGKWLREHRRVFGAPRFFVRDAELAIASATAQKPPDLFHELRGALAVAAARSVALGVPPTVIEVLAAREREEEAEGYAELADREDMRARAFAALAAGLQRAGNTERARAAFDLAVDALRGDEASLWEDEVIQDLGDTAALVLSVEGLERVAAVVQRRSATPLAHSLRLAQRAASLGDVRWSSETFERALREAGAAIDEYQRIAALAGNQDQSASPEEEDDEESDEDEKEEENPERQAWHTLVERRQALVEAIALAVTRRELAMLSSVEALLMRFPRRAQDALPAAALANGFALLGDDQRAALWAGRSLRTFKPDPTFTGDDTVAVVELLGHAPMAQARAKALDALVASARGARGYGRADALGHAIKAAALAQRQDLVDALEHELKAQHDTGEPNLDSAFESLAAVAARRGEVDKTRELIERLELSDGSVRDAARKQAVTELIEAGRLNDALALAQEVTDSHVRSDALGEVARGALIVGQHNIAIESADRAIAASGSLDNPETGAYFLSSVALALAEIGRPAEARAHALRAKTLIDQTLPGARTGRDTKPVALALIKVGELDVAQPFIDTLMESFRTDARRELALALRAHGAADRARAIVQQLREEDPELSFAEPAYRFAMAAELVRLEGNTVQARTDAAEAERRYFANRRSSDIHYGNVLLKIVDEYKHLGDAKAAARLRRRVVGRKKSIAQDIELSMVAAAALQAEGDAAAAQQTARRALETFNPRDPTNPFASSREVPELARLVGSEALPLLDRLRRRTQAVADPYDRARHLQFLARSYQLVSDAGRALDTMREAVQVARSARLFVTLEVIGESADILAQVDGGDTLLRVSAAYDDVKAWWAAGNTRPV